MNRVRQKGQFLHTDFDHFLFNLWLFTLRTTTRRICFLLLCHNVSSKCLFVCGYFSTVFIWIQNFRVSKLLVLLRNELISLHHVNHMLLLKGSYIIYFWNGVFLLWRSNLLNWNLYFCKEYFWMYLYLKNLFMIVNKWFSHD